MFHSLLKPLFSDIKTFVLDILFPISCLGCEKEGKYICADCAFELTEAGQICIGCKKPSVAGLTHPKCFTPHMPEQLLTFFNYQDNLVSKLIIKGKYYFLKDIFSELGEIIAEKIKKDFPELNNSVIPAPEPESIPGSRIKSGMTQTNFAELSAKNYYLLPIPLHSRRLRWRGFNQSEIFAQSLSTKLNLPIANILIRNKSTKTQKDLKRDQRIKNIESAFTINPSPSPFLEKGEVTAVCPSSIGGIAEGWGCIRNNNFILTDDVTTTGATLLEAAKVLKRNGAKKVICLTIARD